VGEGTCQFLIPECQGLAVGTSVCSEYGAEAFTCGEGLAVKNDAESCAHFCSQGACVEPPSCVDSESGCGQDLLDGGCCKSPLVPGGAFNRGSTSDFPATVADFRLDKYEVTVQRFRKFVAAAVEGWMPPHGSGKHTHLRGGGGLVAGVGALEAGWDAAWNIADNGLFATAGDWDEALQCGSSNYYTWTPGADLNELLPINCLNWYQAAAFCIWDGGFLPSEAEWEYAAAGGALERLYPWGTSEPMPTLAVYDCQADGLAACSFLDIPTVGSRPAGDTAFGQSDLGGSVGEWALDWFSASDSRPLPCDNCASLIVATERTNRGGSWLDNGEGMQNHYRNAPEPYVANEFFGVRCARAP
jgi:sulfatase modifying factor 1